jgi:uncharacterized protein with LGFP repeats
MRLGPRTAHASERLVRRLSGTLGGSTWSRRSFLVRTSVLSSAVAMDLKAYALTPGSAYDSVCGTLAACDDAFTAFCCTINHGANLCPEATFIGGWWKADRSTFCKGASRYYVDCNGTADSHWECHCSDSPTCDKRKVACNVFRYGNCNLEVPVADTAVVCRVVTCTPPWEWDRACTETSFTDDLTGSQTAPCLPPPGSPPILVKWYDTGGAGGPLGAQLGRLHSLPDGDGTWGEFRHGAIFDVHWLGTYAVLGPVWVVVRDHVGRPGIGYPAQDSGATPDGEGWSQLFATRAGGRQSDDAEAVGTRSLGTYVVTGRVLSKWHALGAEDGLLGYPTTDTLTNADGHGTHGEFAKLVHGHVRYRGAIFEHPVIGAHAMVGRIYDKWFGLGGQASPLGLPSSDRRGLGVRHGYQNDFAVVKGGAVLSRGTIASTDELGTWGIWGPLHSRWVASGGQHGPLGLPTSDVVATPDRTSSFATFRPLAGSTDATGGGVVASTTWGAWALLGSFFEIWHADQLGARSLGVPAAAEVDQVVGGIALRSQVFSAGALYDSVVGASCVLVGPILQQYLADGGPTSSLGLPTSSVSALADGDQLATFQFGTLTYVPGSGVTRT